MIRAGSCYHPDLDEATGWYFATQAGKSSLASAQVTKAQNPVLTPEAWNLDTKFDDGKTGLR